MLVIRWRIPLGHKESLPYPRGRKHDPGVEGVAGSRMVFVLRVWNILGIDPMVTALNVLNVIRKTWYIIKDSGDILMQSSSPIGYKEIVRL